MRTIPAVAVKSYIDRVVKNHRTIATVDTAAVSRAAGALEGTAALVDDMEDDKILPLSMTVCELRNFVHYMRTLDATARETAPAVEELRELRKECDQYLARIKLLEKDLESKDAEAAAKDGPSLEPVISRIWGRTKKSARGKTAAQRDGSKSRTGRVRPEK